GCATRLGTYVVLRQDATRSQQQGEPACAALVTGHILGDHEAALAAHEFFHVHDGCTFGRVFVAWPLYAAAQLFDLVERYTPEGRRQTGDFVHDLAGMRVIHGVTHG